MRGSSTSETTGGATKEMLSAAERAGTPREMRCVATVSRRERADALGWATKPVDHSVSCQETSVHTSETADSSHPPSVVTVAPTSPAVVVVDVGEQTGALEQLAHTRSRLRTVPGFVSTPSSKRTLSAGSLTRMLPDGGGGDGGGGTDDGIAGGGCNGGELKQRHRQRTVLDELKHVCVLVMSLGRTH